ncbi:Heme peroxidase [Mycena chlorophos]|uniref:Heme peroxidase n=1 Tax=Mycena chlorophos TaxID=658473 RepID=A0A8H6WJT2_MYCCL|nr:Heme peroxidase [Mycena chlorophos]
MFPVQQTILASTTCEDSEFDADTVPARAFPTAISVAHVTSTSVFLAPACHHRSFLSSSTLSSLLPSGRTTFISKACGNGVDCVRILTRLRQGKTIRVDESGRARCLCFVRAVPPDDASHGWRSASHTTRRACPSTSLVAAPQGRASWQRPQDSESLTLLSRHDRTAGVARLSRPIFRSATTPAVAVSDDDERNAESTFAPSNGRLENGLTWCGRALTRALGRADVELSHPARGYPSRREWTGPGARRRCRRSRSTGTGHASVVGADTQAVESTSPAASTRSVGGTGGRPSRLRRLQHVARQPPRTPSTVHARAISDIRSDRVSVAWVPGDPDKQRLRRDAGFWYLGIGSGTRRQCRLSLWPGLQDICALCIVRMAECGMATAIINLLVSTLVDIGPIPYRKPSDD